MANSNPASPAGSSASLSTENKLTEALQLMRRALTLLDGAEGPDEVGAHLDLAITRLEEWIESRGPKP